MSRNVVLVTVDSLRADHCSFMGNGRETTPALDRLAADGIVFENAIAPGPITPESLPATFTGRDPVTATAGKERKTATREVIRRHMAVNDTLPEKLSRRGYATGAFTPNPWTSRYFGFDAGFDHFQDYMGADLSRSIWERMLDGADSQLLSAARLVLSWLQRENVFKPWSELLDEVVAWTESASEPYFLWVFLLDVHFPYLAGDQYRSQSRWREYEANLRLYLEDQQTPYSPRVHDQLATAYEDSVRFTDACFARLRERLPGDPAFVVHADHGEAFGEHGSYTHQDELYEENVHVPLVVTGAGSGTVERPVSLRAIPEIVTGVADTGRVPDVAEPFVVTKSAAGGGVALRGQRLKYVRRDGGDELYDLARGETDQIDDEELAALCRAILRAETEGEAEARRVKDAVQGFGPEP